MYQKLTMYGMLHAAVAAAMAPLLSVPVLLAGAATAHADVTEVSARADRNSGDPRIVVTLVTDSTDDVCGVYIDGTPGPSGVHNIPPNFRRNITVSDVGYGNHTVNAHCAAAGWLDGGTVFIRPKAPVPIVTDEPPAAPIGS